MSKRIRVAVGRIEERPRLDPYRQDTGYPTYSEILLNPQARTISIVQSSRARGVGTPIEIYTGRVLSGCIGGDERDDGDDLYPLAADTRRYLRGREGQALLRRICDGWDTAWDGHNIVGRLSADATQAWHDLQATLAEHAQEARYTDASDWYTSDDDVRITAHTTDEEIDALAAADERAAWDDSRTAIGGCTERFFRIRNERSSARAEV